MVFSMKIMCKRLYNFSILSFLNDLMENHDQNQWCSKTGKILIFLSTYDFFKNIFKADHFFSEFFICFENLYFLKFFNSFNKKKSDNFVS